MNEVIVNKPNKTAEEKESNDFNNLPEEKSHWEKYKFYYLVLGSFFFALLIILLANSNTNNELKKVNRRISNLESNSSGDSQGNGKERTPLFFDKDFIVPQKKDQDKNWLENQIFQKSLRQELKNKINYFNNIKPYLTNKATHINRNILFYGPPGTGKSYYAELLAKNESSAYITVHAGELQRIFVGSGGGKWREFFDKAKKQARRLGADAKPVMIIVDEFDSLGGRGKDDPIHKKDDTLINTFLTSMDELHNEKLNIAVLATTNYLNMLENAAIRAGRFDSKIEVGYPRTQEEYDELCDHLKKQVEWEFKNNTNREFWINKNENKIIEFAPGFWSDIKRQVWTEISQSEEILKNSGFDLLGLKVMVKNCIENKISTDSQRISIGNEEVTEFTKQLKKEIEAKEKTKKGEEKEKKKNWEDFAKALREGMRN